MKSKILLFTLLLSTVTVFSQTFVENFENATVNGNLEGYNGWYVSPKAGDNLGASPKIDEMPLFYTNYPGSNVGKVALLDSVIGATSANQRISTRRIIFAGNDTLKVPAAGAFYAAFIVNIKPQSFRSYRDFFTWEGSETSSFTRGRYFAKNNTEGSEVTFAVTKNSTSAADFKNTFDDLGLTLQTGVNYLLVAKYEIVSGSNNDIVSLFVNPDPLKTEAQNAAVKISAVDTQTDYSTGTAMKINLRQRGIGAEIGGIRVSRTWGEAVMGQTTGLISSKANIHNIYSVNKDIVTGQSGVIKVFTMSGALLVDEYCAGRYSSNLSNGLYLVDFTDNNGVVSKAKVFVK